MYDIKEVLKGKPFIREIEFLKEEGRSGIILRSGKVSLYDFSVLHIKEIWKKGFIDKYSYYWFSANNKLIIGWDNAPHHKEIISFPHHKHQKNKVVPSEEKGLIDVIEFLNSIFDLKKQ